MMKRLFILALFTCCLAWGSAAPAAAPETAAPTRDGHALNGNELAAQPVPSAAAHAGPGPMSGNPDPAAQEYGKAMEAMHGPMMQGIMDPDPDVAFVKGMIPHHQGAVDMARIVLKYGKDPELHKLAREIIESQEKEIRFMEGWLKKHGR